MSLLLLWEDYARTVLFAVAAGLTGPYVAKASAGVGINGPYWAQTAVYAIAIFVVLEIRFNKRGAY